MTDEATSGQIAPLPYSAFEIGTQTGAGFHIYLRDANGRKIAAIWGTRDEKPWTADLLVRAANSHADLLAAAQQTLDCGQSLNPEMTAAYQALRKAVAKAKA